MSEGTGTVPGAGAGKKVCHFPSLRRAIVDNQCKQTLNHSQTPSALNTHTHLAVLRWPTENRLKAGKTRPVQLVCFLSFFSSPLKHRPTPSKLLNFSVLCTSDVLDNWNMYFIPHCCKTFKFGGKGVSYHILHFIGQGLTSSTVIADRGIKVSF